MRAVASIANDSSVLGAIHGLSRADCVTIVRCDIPHERGVLEEGASVAPLAAAAAAAPVQHAQPASVRTNGKDKEAALVFV